MSNAPRLTDAQRAAAIDRAGESIALLSGAGCGKTFVLSKRYVQLLLIAGEDADLSRIVALTFTDKAAVEMSQRVRRELLELADNSDGSKRRMPLGWLEQLPHARISTIHSFCASILRQAAVEAGVDPAFAVCSDQLLADRLIAEAADEALLSAVESRSKGAAELLTGHSFQQIVELISDLVDRRTAVDLSAHGDPPGTLQRWQNQLIRDRAAAWRRLDNNAEVKYLLNEIAAAQCDSEDDKLLPLRNALVAAAKHISAGGDALTAENFAAVNIKPGSVGSDKNWGGKGSAKSVRDAMRTLSDALGEYAIFTENLGALDEQAARAIATLTGLAISAREIYTKAKRSRGLLDFTDLLERTGHLLESNPAVRSSVAANIDQLLIDECQDTDAFQISLLARLIFTEKDADTAAAPPPGRLFVVGDAKQSIYRFRGAQVEVFSDLCEQMGPGNVENLDRSFRTHSAGVEFINELFAPLMGSRYTPITAHRSDTPPGPGVEILLAMAQTDDDQPIKTAKQASAAQAAVTAERIAAMLDDGEKLIWDAQAGQHRAVRAGDICILLARMTDSLRYERQLQQRDVPYYVIAGTGFFRRQEVYDVLNALRVIDCAEDDVALIGVLRGDMFALDDNALMHLTDAISPHYLPALSSGNMQAAAAKLSQPHRKSLALAVETLSSLRRCKDAIGIDCLIERLLAACGYEAVLLTQPQGRRMLGNVRMLIDRARSASAEGVALADFITQVQEMVISESRYEQAAVASEADDVVRIMTIHKAKGLEFPVVILPDLNASRRASSEPTLIRPDWGLTWHLSPSDDDDAQGSDNDSDDEKPLSSRIARLMEKNDSQGEDIRKWYVAATRHSDHLVFVGADWRDRAGAFRNNGCFLRQMDQVLGIAETADAGKVTIEYAGEKGEKFTAALRRVTPSAPSGGKGKKQSAGAKLLAKCASGGDLAKQLTAAAGKAAAPPLLGPVPIETARAQVAVTALGQFEHCPMLYRWQYELRVPSAMLAERDTKKTSRPAATIDAATAGTLFHRCMELLDFASPQRAENLVGTVAEEMELNEQADLPALSTELNEMLRQFESHELRQALLTAGDERIFRELDFSLQLGQVLLRGQIDMLYIDDAGGHIVDYKSDRLVGGESPADHSKRYELQMLIYALAAAAHKSSPPADATLYFLRTGQTHVIEMSKARLESAHQRIGDLCNRLITARRSGKFDRRSDEACGHCPYRALCDNQ